MVNNPNSTFLFFSILSIFLISLNTHTVILTSDAHGFLIYPKSRNYYYGVGPQYHNPSVMDGEDAVDSLSGDISPGPNGMQVEKTQGHEVCGDSSLYNRFTDPTSPYSSTPIQAIFNAGSTVDVKVKVTIYHYGWFEFRLCTSSSVNQDCLNQHVLELDEVYSKAQYSSNQMARGLLNTLDYAGIATDNYDHHHTLCENIPYSPKGSCCNGGGTCSAPAQNKHRWMLPAPDVDDQEYTIRLKIPSGISCDKCVLQWYWQTGNSIDNYPQAFWNCADVKVVNKEDETIILPGSNQNQVYRRADFINAADASCTGKPCSDITMCRSEWGYCGKTDAYCNDKSIWKPSCLSSTPKPTKAQTAFPTKRPKRTTSSPTKKTRSPSKLPGTKSPTSPTNTKSPTTPTSMPATAQAFFTTLEGKSSALDSQVLLYQTPSNAWVHSAIYHATDLVAGLKAMVQIGVAGKFFYVGEDVGLTPEENAKVGLVGLAAFLAQSKKEAIMYDACDENNWDEVNGKYPLSNACGQLSQSYQDYKGDHTCPLDPTMEITATTNAKWYGAPGPLFCGPKSKTGSTGYWDTTFDCSKLPNVCNAYPGQQAGRYDNTSPVANRLGRTDVENCCWWGRGVIQTTGRGHYGDLNYYLGKGAADRGAAAAFPDVDFCKTPDAVCASSKYPELKWVAGLFYWMNAVQTYNEGGWDYKTKLKEYVAGGIKNPGTDSGFIGAISGIVNRGCHNPPCASGPVDGGSDRAKYFKETLQSLGLVA